MHFSVKCIQLMAFTTLVGNAQTITQIQTMKKPQIRAGSVAFLVAF